MSLVIFLIGQLNCHIIGCKTRKSRLVRLDPSIQSFASQIVSSVYCLSVSVSFTMLRLLLRTT